LNEQDAMIPPAITIGPRPLKILGEVALVSIAGTAGVSILVVFLGFLTHPWFLSNAPIIIACAAAILICWCVIAVLGAILWGRPRVEIRPEGFTDYGILGHRSRRWSDIDGSFTVIPVGWPFAVGRRRVVAYRLTGALKESARGQSAWLAGNDEAILICPELAIGADQLVEVLNSWKQGVPSATTSD
jgi:hypothetical protein